MDGRRKRDVRASNFSLDFDSASKNLGGMDSNMVLEVPDTPDGLARKKSSFGRDVNSNRDPVRTYISRDRHSSHHNSSGSSNGTNDAEFFFREANLARQLPDAAQPKPVSQSHCKPLKLGNTRVSDGSVTSRETVDLDRKHPGTKTGLLCDSEIFVIDDEKIDNAGLKPGDKGKGIDLCSNSKLRTDISLEARCFPNSGVREMSSLCTETGDRGIVKGKDLCGDLTLVNSGQPHRPRSAQKRLVRNGCISPLNIERSRNSGKQKEVQVRNEGSLSNPVHIMSPDFQEKNCSKLKGKLTAEHIVAASDGSSSPSDSVQQFSGKGVPVSADVGGSGHRFEDKGWRTTRNHMSKPSSFPMRDHNSGLRSENLSVDPVNGKHEVALSNGSSVNVRLVNPGATTLQHGVNSNVLQDFHTSHQENERIKGKRKASSSRSHAGECSSSVSNDPESLNTGSSRRSLSARTTRIRRSQHDGRILGPVIEVDEQQSPELVSNSIDLQRQVESDEMLARQLQEELYNETPRTEDTDEIGASMALSLQEHDGHGAAIARRHQSRRSDLSNPSSRVRFRQTSVQGIGRPRASTSSRMAQLRREFHRTLMELNTRMGIMGGVPFGGGDNDARMLSILHSQRDFNENDYETLLQLDENNHQHGGASDRQINNLPESIIQNEDPQEACAVCLEHPAIGDTIRHLPCLHKFHKDCIDAWLRRKRSCPICKYDIR